MVLCTSTIDRFLAVISTIAEGGNGKNGRMPGTLWCIYCFAPLSGPKTRHFQSDIFPDTVFVPSVTAFVGEAFLSMVRPVVRKVLCAWLQKPVKKVTTPTYARILKTFTTPPSFPPQAWALLILRRLSTEKHGIDRQ